MSKHHPAQQYSRTALHIATEKGHLEVVRLLLEYGANKEIINFVGAVRFPCGLSSAAVCD